MRNYLGLCLVVMAGSLLGAEVRAVQEGESPAIRSASPAPAELASMIAKLKGSFVQVEVTPRFDGGEAPYDILTMPSSGGCVSKSMADSVSASFITDSWSEVMREERPVTAGGFLVAPDRVFTAELALHPRFVKSIVVRLGDEAVAATVDGYLADEPGMFLKLERPINGGKPLSFGADAGEPAVGIRYNKIDGEWVVTASGAPGGVMVTEQGNATTRGAGNTLLVDRDDTPVTILSGGHLRVDGSWRIDPAKKLCVSSDQWSDAIAKIREASEMQVPRVHIQFRSPATGSERRRSYFRDSDDGVQTEWFGPGLMVDDRTILIPAGFNPKTTARLEKITVHFPGGSERQATFAGNLRDWQGMVATFDESIGTGAKLRAGQVTDLRDRLLVQGSIAVKGETRTAHFGTQRVRDFEEGFRGVLYPSMTAVSGGGRWDDRGLAYHTFLFTLDGEIAAVPMGRRDRLNTGDRSYSRSGDDKLVPSDVVRDALRQGKSAYDADNKPLSKEDELRLAWIGVEMQGMNPDLARANDIVELTNGGRSGGIVTYVYADSPAAQAGMQVGDVLLRIQIDGQPKPLEIEVEDNGMGSVMDRYWEYLDRVPEEYMDRIPSPWGNAETPVIRSLTDMGFGTGYTIEAVREGKTLQFPMVVTLGPSHYEAAAKFKSEDLGLTVKDITYEVRRYFQMKPEDTGVIIAKVERGGRAAVAGLKPLETIRSVNDKPVASVKDFEDAVKTGGEFKMAVKRMTQGRTVVVKPGAKPAQSSEEMPKSDEDADDR
ncbi:MAG: hypothetical protein KF691_01710 [Phycisphaeraceae bacterium]|nr:hypothetical protein [Phycisphaeraceae bacterium]